MVHYADKSTSRDHFLDVIGDQLLKCYLLTNADIRACPSKDCDYRGIIPLDELMHCGVKLECEKCKVKWLD